MATLSADQRWRFESTSNRWEVRIDAVGKPDARSKPALHFAADGFAQAHDVARVHLSIENIRKVLRLERATYSSLWCVTNSAKPGSLRHVS